MASNPDFVQYIVDQCSGANVLNELDERRPYPGAKLYFYVRDVVFPGPQGFFCPASGHQFQVPCEVPEIAA